ncbi:MAG: tetraacyldisaccharide 4'-kinase [Alphaproteobacteria bacterium]
MKTPSFWEEGNQHPLALMLSPLSLLWGLGAKARSTLGKRATPIANCPIICVGNIVAGGGGKTPLALWLLRGLSESGVAANGLARGVGGTVSGFERIGVNGLSPDCLLPDAARHGDEPCLLAQVAPTWVARNRAEAARAAAKAGAECLVSDDGLQSPALHKDFVILAFRSDYGEYGCGNGRLIPAGPLREPLSAGLARADAVFITHPAKSAIPSTKPDFLKDFSAPVFHGRLILQNQENLRGRRFVAFSGIAHPHRFFDSLREAGAEPIQTRTFGDHHRFRNRDLHALKSLAHNAGVPLITTEKDAVRLPPDFVDFTEVARARLHPEHPTELLSCVRSVIQNKP